MEIRKVAIQGFEGSYHHIASNAFFEEEVDIIPCMTFKEIFAAIKKDKPFFDIALGIVLLALVLLFVFVVKNPRFKSKKKNTEPGQKPKNEPIPDQSDDKQTITTLRRDLSALMNSMNDLNQTFMTFLRIGDT